MTKHILGQQPLGCVQFHGKQRALVQSYSAFSICTLRLIQVWTLSLYPSNHSCYVNHCQVHLTPDVICCRRIKVFYVVFALVTSFVHRHINQLHTSSYILSFHYFLCLLICLCRVHSSTSESLTTTARHNCLGWAHCQPCLNEIQVVAKGSFVVILIGLFIGILDRTRHINSWVSKYLQTNHTGCIPWTVEKFVVLFCFRCCLFWASVAFMCQGHVGKWHSVRCLWVDGGFGPTCQDFGGRFEDSFPALLLFYLKWRSVHTYQFHFLGQDQSTVALWAKMTVAKCLLTSCMWAHIPARFPHCAWIVCMYV